MAKKAPATRKSPTKTAAKKKPAKKAGTRSRTPADSGGSTAVIDVDAVTVETAAASFEEQILSALTSLSNGDFSIRLPLAETGVTGKVYDVLNDLLSRGQFLTEEMVRVSEEVGRDGTQRQTSGRRCCPSGEQRTPRRVRPVRIARSQSTAARDRRVVVLD